MIYYSRNDMVYKDYSWNAILGDSPRVTGEPDSTLLSRTEGYEILYFINKYATNHWFSQISQCQKVEKMIRLSVPFNIHSQRNIYDWVEANWNNYSY